MAWTTDFRSSLIEIHVIGMSAKEQIFGVRSMSINANPTVRKEVATGSKFAASASLENLAPVANFTTTHLKQAIDFLGVSGKCIESDGTHPGFDIYVQLQGCEGPESGSVHRRYRIEKGIIVPRTLSVDHRGDAAMTFDVLATYDGVNDPIEVTDAVAIPATSLPATVGKDDRYTMDKMLFAGSDVEGKRSINIDFGSQTTSEGADSLPFDTVQAITAILPVLTVTGVDIKWLATILDMRGESVLNASPIDVYLKKRNVAAATAEHIRLRSQGLANWDNFLTAQPDSPSTAAFRVDLLEEGANAPIAVNTAIAIP
jgi:hypothetical protein